MKSWAQPDASPLAQSLAWHGPPVNDFHVSTQGKLLAAANLLLFPCTHPEVKVARLRTCVRGDMGVLRN